MKNAFFARMGEREAAGMFSAAHLFLFCLTMIFLKVALDRTLLMDYGTLRVMIRCISVVLWILEGMKIGWHFSCGNKGNKDMWFPLYFCSITLYAAVLSGWATGPVQKAADIFMATGGMISGICFLLYPSTSLMVYPLWHFLSLHSFFYHGTMVYLGILLNRTGMVNLTMRDFPVYVLFSLGWCILAGYLNHKLDMNMMFLKEPVEDSFMEKIYNKSQKLYQIGSLVIQCSVPFLVIMIFKVTTPWLTRPAWYP